MGLCCLYTNKFRKFYLTTGCHVAIMCIDYSKNIKGGGTMYNRTTRYMMSFDETLFANKIHAAYHLVLVGH